MGTKHVFRAGSGRGDGIHILVGSVGGENRLRLAGGIELGEDFLLQFEVLEHRLDHNVGIGDFGIVGGAGDQAHAALDIVLAQLAALDGDAVVLADDFHAAVECAVADFEQRHWNPRVGEAHGDAAAHGAAADDRRLADFALRGVFGQALDLRRLPLGEKDMAHGGGFRRGDELPEQFALALERLVDWQFDRGFEATDDAVRGDLAPRPGVHPLAGLLEKARLDGCRVDHDVADTLERRAGFDEFPGIADRAFEQIAFDDLVDEAHVVGLARGNRIARGDDVQSGFDAGDARQALGSAGAGKQAELDLGQADFGAGDGAAVMAGERNLEAAAEGGAVDRRDHRLA